MKALVVLTFFLGILLLFCGCFETQLTTQYINETYGIGIDPPEDWIQQEYAHPQVITGWGADINSTVSLVISSSFRLDEGLALSVFADDIEETYPNQYSNYSTLYRDWLTVGGLTAYEIVYSYSLNDSDIKERQVMVKHTRDVYILTYKATFSEYDIYESVVDTSISTFSVK